MNAVTWIHVAGGMVALVSGAIAFSGGYFFIWTLFALGVTGLFSLMLSIDRLWRLRQTRGSEIEAASLISWGAHAASTAHCQPLSRRAHPTR